MKEKISKIMLKRTNQIIALIVLIITAIGAIAVSRNKIKNITNLDSETAQDMIDILKRLAKQRNKCVIVVTHSSEVAHAANIVLELKDKKLKETYHD